MAKSVPAVIALGRPPENQRFVLWDQKAPPADQWKMATGTSMTDPEYQRARTIAEQYLKGWFKERSTYQAMPSQRRRIRFKAVLPYWSHLCADYALWARVDAKVRPPHWPQNSSEFARFHTTTYAELCTILNRVKFRRYVRRLFPPIPASLLIDQVKLKVVEMAMNADITRPRDAKIALELFLKTFNVGGYRQGTGISINNTNQMANTPEGDAHSEEELASALRVLGPFLSKILPMKEVKALATEEINADPAPEEPAALSEADSPEGDG